MIVLEIATNSREELIDITARIKEAVSSFPVKNGIVVVFIPHTTAGVTINENADPSVRFDILMSFKNLVPDTLPYTHQEGNSPAHVKAALVGSSISILLENVYLRGSSHYWLLVVIVPRPVWSITQARYRSLGLVKPEPVVITIWFVKQRQKQLDTKHRRLPGRTLAGQQSSLNLLL